MRIRWLATSLGVFCLVLVIVVAGQAKAPISDVTSALISGKLPGSATIGVEPASAVLDDSVRARWLGQEEQANAVALEDDAGPYPDDADRSAIRRPDTRRYRRTYRVLQEASQ